MIRYILACAILICGVQPVWSAESAQAPQEEEQNLGNPLAKEPTAIQAPDQTEEKDKAVNLSFLYTAELWDNVSGGIKQGQSTINNFDASIAVDGEKTFGWDGANFLLDTFYARSGNLRNLTGAAQQTSAYETDTGNLFRVYQAWYDQKFNQDQTSVLVGIYDLNSEFNTFEQSELFFNSGYGVDSTFDQTGLNGPSLYPDTSLALRLRQKLGSDFSVQAAILDGVPDDPNHPTSTSIDIGSGQGALLVGEIDYLPNDDTKMLAGYWHYTAKFEELGMNETNPPMRTGNQGGYVGIGQLLYEKNDQSKLNGFLRLGLAETTFNQFGRSLDTGLVYTGLIAGRDKDQIGIAMNIEQNGQPFLEDQRTVGTNPRNYESNLEVTYRAPINGWLTVQPDVQYTVNPGTNPALKNDLIVGIRLEFGYKVGFDSL